MGSFGEFPRCRCVACILDHGGDTPVGRFLLWPLLAPVRSLLFRANPVRISYKLLCYLMIGGVSTLGEELGWRGFLQGSLRPLGRVRGYLLLALMWEAWHFTSHMKGTLTEVVSRMSIYIPLVVAVTFLLGFVVERTDSLLPVTLHEWLDIAVDSGATYLMWAALACIPLRLWLIWTWPDPASVHMPTSTSEARETKQIVVTRECRGSVS